MTKNKLTILQAIRNKPLLQLEDFQVFQTQKKSILKDNKVSNTDILDRLNFVYEACSVIITHNTNSISVNSETKGLELTREEYYKAKVQELRFNESSTFFTPRFEKKIRDTISNNVYQNMSVEEVKKLNTNLQDLSTIEFEWKEYHRRTINKEMAHTQFRQAFKNFELSFESLKSPTEVDLVGQRAARKFMPYKLGLFAQTISQFLYSCHDFKSLEFCKDYTVEEFGDIIIHHLDTKRVFNDLVRVSVKKAHEKLLNLRGHTRYKDDVLSLQRSELVGEITKSLAIEVLYAVLLRGELLKKITEDACTTMSIEIQTLVLSKGLLLQTESHNKFSYLSFIDIIQSIVAMFISCNFFTNVVSTTTETRGKMLTLTQLILPDKLIVDSFRPLKFPNIVMPEKLQKKDIDRLISPLINGMGTLTKSDDLVTALNISRSKKHKVSILFFRLCQEFFKRNSLSPHNESIFEKWLGEGMIDVGTLSKRTIDSMRFETENIQESESSNLSLNIANAVLVQLSKTFGIGIKSYIHMLPYTGVSKAEILRYFSIKTLKSDYISALIDSKYTQSRLFLAVSLLTFPIYVTDTLCIRLRKYPREH